VLSKPHTCYSKSVTANALRNDKPMTNRFIKYLLLGILTIVTPHVTTMILIIVTGDRIEGMKLGTIPGVILPHLIFGLAFIKKQLTTKFLLTTLVTATIFGLLIVTIRLELIKTNFDMYGFWDLAVTNFIVGVITWETFYHVDKLQLKDG
jgi:hypothetical protein